MAFGFLSRLVDSNDRELKRLQPILTAVNARADEMEAASAEEIRGRMEAIAADPAKSAAASRITARRVQRFRRASRMVGS